jgi:hypothetical protein
VIEVGFSDQGGLNGFVVAFDHRPRRAVLGGVLGDTIDDVVGAERMSAELCIAYESKIVSVVDVVNFDHLARSRALRGTMLL